MLLVATELRESRIHGIGLFAAQQIKKGTPVWRFSSLIDLRLEHGIIQRLALPARSQIDSYVYLDNRTHELILCGDDARFFNHSPIPNVIDDPSDPHLCIAARDIEFGEELTQDYRSFDLLAVKKLKSEDTAEVSCAACDHPQPSPSEFRVPSSGST